MAMTKYISEAITIDSIDISETDGLLEATVKLSIWVDTDIAPMITYGIGDTNISRIPTVLTDVKPYEYIDVLTFKVYEVYTDFIDITVKLYDYIVRSKIDISKLIRDENEFPDVGIWIMI